MHSHFRVQPNYSVEVVLYCVVVGVVTIICIFSEDSQRYLAIAISSVCLLVKVS